MGWENQPILISLLSKEVVDIKKEKKQQLSRKMDQGHEHSSQKRKDQMSLTLG